MDVRHPPSQRLASQRLLQPSRFLIECLRDMALPSVASVLDIPSGTGRNSAYLARLGHRITVADIDGKLLEATEARLNEAGLTVTGFALDAAKSLPFSRASFDLAVVVDFVDENLLCSIEDVIRPNGYLIYESYAPRGQNWRQLLPKGRTEKLLQKYDLLSVVSKSTGPEGDLREAIKVLARKQ